MDASNISLVIGLLSGATGSALGAGIAWGVIKERVAKVDEELGHIERRSEERDRSLTQQIDQSERRCVERDEQLGREIQVAAASALDAHGRISRHIENHPAVNRG